MLGTLPRTLSPCHGPFVHTKPLARLGIGKYWRNCIGITTASAVFLHLLWSRSHASSSPGCVCLCASGTKVTNQCGFFWPFTPPHSTGQIWEANGGVSKKHTLTHTRFAQLNAFKVTKRNGACMQGLWAGPTQAGGNGVSSY